MKLKKIASDTILEAEQADKVIHQNGGTSDIISVIMMADAHSAKYTKDFSEYLIDMEQDDQCETLYAFVQDNIHYKEDPIGEQWVKSPSRLWEDKEGDCKSFSLFIGSVLKNLNIPFVYRFAGYEEYGDVTHVYIVAFPGDDEIILDAVPPMTYNEEASGFKKFIDIAPITNISGVSTNRNMGYQKRVAGAPTSATSFFLLFGFGLLIFNRL